MTRLNWAKANAQKRAQKYGLEIDYSVGSDPNKIPENEGPSRDRIMRKILGSSEDEE
jgi:hypothetical protein